MATTTKIFGTGKREGHWRLKNPQRFTEPIPTAGRMSLFQVDLPEAVIQTATDEAISDNQADKNTEIEAAFAPSKSPVVPTASTPKQAIQQPTTATRKANTQGRTVHYRAETVNEKTLLPFRLEVIPTPGERTDFAIALLERGLHSHQSPGNEMQDANTLLQAEALPSMTPVVSLAGDALRAVADHVIDALRLAGYKATDLSPTRQLPFYLPEAVGVRLGLVLLAVKPLTKLNRIEAISHGIRQMPAEEIYYWYSKCTTSQSGERAQKALRLLLADE